MFQQRIVDSDDPTTCVIVGELDGVEVWRSTAPSAIDPAIRIAIDGPTLVDLGGKEVGYRVPSKAEYLALTDCRERDYDADHHREVATLATVVGAVSLKDAAVAVELSEEALTDEALAWEAASVEAP